MTIKFEEPCDSSKGGSCQFIWHDEYYDENGEEAIGDLYCAKCGRYRDWSKEEYEEEIK